MIFRTFAIFFFAASLLAACKPSNEPPPDILKFQRQALDKAKALQGQMQQDSEQRMKQADGDQDK